MKALILAGGYATRLRPLSYVLPKLLFPVCGRPILEQTIQHLASFGVHEVILAVNYMADQLRHHFGEEYHGVGIRYSLEDKPLGTGGPIAFARRYLDRDDAFLVMNGDIVSEIDIDAMKRLHETAHALVTIALHEVSDPTRFGVARLDSQCKIREFVEKPRLEDAPSRLVNAGMYVMEPEVINRIASGRKVIVERELFPALAREGKLFGYVHSGTWFDIGNVSDFINANFTLLDSRSRGQVVEEDGVRVSKSAKLDGPMFVGDGAAVDDDARLGPQTIIGRRVHVHRNARVTGTIVFDDSSIGSGSLVEKTVIGNSVVLGNDVVIGKGSVVAGHVKICDRVRIAHDVYIHPYKEIGEDILTPGHVV